MTDEEKAHARLSETLHHLKKLRDLLDKEEPPPSFVFVIESKIRSYRKKYLATHPNAIVRTPKDQPR